MVLQDEGPTSHDNPCLEIETKITPVTTEEKSTPNIEPLREENEDNLKCVTDNLSILPPENKWYKANLEMIPCKISYLLYGGVVGSYFPYLQMFLASVGLTPVEAGFMVGLQSIVTSSVDPVWGLIADPTGRRKLVLFFLCLMSALIITPLPWIVTLFQNEQENYNNDSMHHNLTLPHEGLAEVFLTTPKCTNSLRYVLTALILVGAVFYSPLPGFLDGITANVIKNSSTKGTYGTQRIWGSISSGLSSYLIGLAADHFKVSNLSPYTPVFLFYCGVALLIIPVGNILINRSKIKVIKNDSKGDAENADVEKAQEASIGGLLLEMAKIPDNIVFLCTILVSGFAFNIYVYFTLLLIAYEVPNTKAMMSLALVVECASNLVMFPLSDPLIRKLGGPSQAMILSLVTYAIRFLIMSYTKTFGLMIAVQSLNGLSFALGWCAFMEHVHKITPKKISMTVFMLLASVHFGVCGLVGNIVGGWVFHQHGGRVLFRGIGIICGGWAIVLAAYRVLLYFINQRNQVQVAMKNNTEPDAPGINNLVKRKSKQNHNHSSGSPGAPNENKTVKDTGQENSTLDSID